jgi:FkbM family methyltransferase
MLKNILQNNGILFENDKIKIPSNFKHIKLDIGLSYNAPQTQEWLKNQSDLMVFGFEPNPTSVSKIKMIPINNINITAGNLFIFPIALGNEQNESVKFYITSCDEGCSSLYLPNEDKFPPGYKVKECINVPVFKLSNFFELLPFDSIEYIEYIKIDAQGSDLNIIKSGEEYISNKVVYVTLEAEKDCHYYGAESCTVENITDYMNSIGFKKINHPNTIDPTYVNLKFIEESKNIYIYQF